VRKGVTIIIRDVKLAHLAEVLFAPVGALSLDWGEVFMASRLGAAFVTLAFVLAVGAWGTGTAEAAMSVEEAVISRGVERLEPVGVGTTFRADIGKLYCFSVVAGAEPPALIRHIWYYEGKRMSEVALPIRHAKFRTYSSKRIMPNCKGGWHVEIVREDGALLRTVNFTVE